MALSCEREGGVATWNDPAVQQVLSHQAMVPAKANMAQLSDRIACFLDEETQVAELVGCSLGEKTGVEYGIVINNSAHALFDTRNWLWGASQHLCLHTRGGVRSPSTH